MSLEHVIVAVIAKYPEAGKVKTRLTSVLSAQDAARVHCVFVKHIVSRLKSVRPLAFKVIFDPPEKLDAMREMLEINDEFIPQCPGDLGARLSHAVDRMRASSGHAPALILAADSPDLPAASLQQAGKLLKEFDIVLGACDDGGYWCLGVAPRVDAKRLLDDIAWSSGRERAQTAARARSLGYSVIETDEWDDVDDPVDLKRLLRRLTESQDAHDQKLLGELCFLPKEMLP